MYELYAHFLAEWLETDHMEGVSKLGVSETEQENKEEEASEALLDLYSRAESAGVASDVLAQGCTAEQSQLELPVMYLHKAM